MSSFIRQCSFLFLFQSQFSFFFTFYFALLLFNSFRWLWIPKSICLCFTLNIEMVEMLLFVTSIQSGIRHFDNITQTHPLFTLTPITFYSTPVFQHAFQKENSLFSHIFDMHVICTRKTQIARRERAKRLTAKEQTHWFIQLILLFYHNNNNYNMKNTVLLRIHIQFECQF